MNYEYAYSSLDKLLDAAQGESVAEYRASRKDTHSNWNALTWEDAIKTALKGDIEGAKRLAPALLKSTNAIIRSHPRLDPVFSIEGGRWIDIARYVKNEPECWGDMVESEPTPRRGVAVIVNVAVSATVAGQSVDAIGVELGSAILGLQAMGLNVTLYACEKITGYGDHNGIFYAPVNPGGSALDISKMCVIMRPWFLRRILFSLQETLPAQARKRLSIGDGYGQPERINAIDARRITGLDNAVIVNISEAVGNPKSVSEKILSQITGV